MHRRRSHGDISSENVIKPRTEAYSRAMKLGEEAEAVTRVRVRGVVAPREPRQGVDVLRAERLLHPFLVYVPKRTRCERIEIARDDAYVRGFFFEGRA